MTKDFDDCLSSPTKSLRNGKNARFMKGKTIRKHSYDPNADKSLNFNFGKSNLNRKNTRNISTVLKNESSFLNKVEKQVDLESHSSKLEIKDSSEF